MTEQRATKRTELIGIRLSLEEIARLNQWRRAQDDPPSKSEAVRLLALRALEEELKSSKKS